MHCSKVWPVLAEPAEFEQCMVKLYFKKINSTSSTNIQAGENK